MRVMLKRFRSATWSHKLRIDQTFDSLGTWKEWASHNTSVFVPAEAKKIATRILASGFIEPLTEISFLPIEINPGASNWREGLVARGVNSRMRAVLALIHEKIDQFPKHEVRIFAAEAITPFALRLRGLFARFLGSEFGMDENAKQTLFPIQHQDLTALTLPSDSFDLVTTNDVLEHIPDLDAGLREIARVLKTGGWHVGTHPFLFMSAKGDLRSHIVGGKVLHLKEPEYHGNPIDPAGGSLVFETPGWDIIDRAHAAGFSNAHMRFVASEKHGYITENTGVFVFCAQK